MLLLLLTTLVAGEITMDCVDGVIALPHKHIGQGSRDACARKANEGRVSFVWRKQRCELYENEIDDLHAYTPGATGADWYTCTTKGSRFLTSKEKCDLCRTTKAKIGKAYMCYAEYQPCHKSEAAVGRDCQIASRWQEDNDCGSASLELVAWDWKTKMCCPVGSEVGKEVALAAAKGCRYATALDKQNDCKRRAFAFGRGRPSAPYTLKGDWCCPVAEEKAVGGDATSEEKAVAGNVMKHAGDCTMDDYFAYDDCWIMNDGSCECRKNAETEVASVVGAFGSRCRQGMVWSTYVNRCVPKFTGSDAAAVAMKKASAGGSPLVVNIFAALGFATTLYGAFRHYTQK